MANGFILLIKVQVEAFGKGVAAIAQGIKANALKVSQLIIPNKTTTLWNREDIRIHERIFPPEGYAQEILSIQ